LINVQLTWAQGAMWVAGPDRLYLGGCRCAFSRFKQHYVEMKVYSHATAGTIDVRINNCPVLSLTSVNTIAGGKATARGGIGATNQIQYGRYLMVDDYYVADGTGNTNNDFLGPVRIQTVWPVSDDTVQFTATGNANYSTHYQQVIRGERDEATDYVMENTVNSIDQFDSSSNADPGGYGWDAINGVAIWGAVGYTTNTANYSYRLTSNGSTTESAVATAPSSTSLTTFIVEEDPSTNAAFTESALGSLITGIKVAP